MKQARTLHLPSGNTAEEAEATYDKALRSLVIELGTHFDISAKPVLGPDWFTDLMSSGHTEEETRQWKSKYDPGFVFGEVLNYPNSPLRLTLPADSGFFFSFKKSRQIRNAWAHNFGEFGLSRLYVDLQHFKAVALGANLPVGNALNPVIARIAAILNGTYLAEPEETIEIPLATETDPDEAEAAFEREAAERQAAEAEENTKRLHFKRPRIGGRWLGDKPSRALRIQERLHDIVDRQSGVSIRHELGAEADEKIDRWLRPKPLGDLFVDTDGAVLGYIQGEPYLMGFMGEQPERNVNDIEGFVLKYSYALEDGDIREEESGKLLSAVAVGDTSQLRAVIRKAVNPLDEVKITTHGDLFSYTDNGPVKIMRVPKELWFPGVL